MFKTSLTIFCAVFFFHCYAFGSTKPAHIKSIHQIMDSLNISPKSISILIDKSDYTLSVLYKKKVLKKYNVVFGKNPIEDKLCEGDRCTPEGCFRIRDKYPHKSWNKFMWIDYPNADSRKKFQLAKKKGLIPENSSIGGEVGIHGVPEGKDYIVDQKQNWTWGCVSLKNKDVQEI